MVKAIAVTDDRIKAMKNQVLIFVTNKWIKLDMVSCVPLSLKYSCRWSETKGDFWQKWERILGVYLIYV